LHIYIICGGKEKKREKGKREKGKKGKREGS
jgi:hypothetical protein